jgi:predicted nucleic acid-binding protein
MAFLFDTDAISELLRPRPATNYIKWLVAIPREEQFTSSIVIGELYKGVYRSQACERHLSNIEQLILPAVTVLPFDIGTAKIFGKIRAHLEETGTILPDADVQIAATALYHGLELVTGNLRHFQRFLDLRLNTILSDSLQKQ